MVEERDVPGLSVLKPVTQTNAKRGEGSVGDVALKDSLIVILACWAVVFSVFFSLRSFNI